MSCPIPYIQYDQGALPFPVEKTRMKKPSSARISAAKKELINKLLSGDYYLMNADHRRKQRGFILYHKNQSPDKWYKRSQLQNLVLLLKQDKKKRLTLNLSLVRQEHGKSIVKQLYKLNKKSINQWR